MKTHTNKGLIKGWTMSNVKGKRWKNDSVLIYLNTTEMYRHLLLILIWHMNGNRPSFVICDRFQVRRYWETMNKQSATAAFFKCAVAHSVSLVSKLLSFSLQLSSSLSLPPSCLLAHFEHFPSHQVPALLSLPSLWLSNNNCDMNIFGTGA